MIDSYEHRFAEHKIASILSDEEVDQARKELLMPLFRLMQLEEQAAACGDRVPDQQPRNFLIYLLGGIPAETNEGDYLNVC